MKIRLIEEYDPSKDETIFKIQKQMPLWPDFRRWSFVDLKLEKGKAYVMWERYKVHGIKVITKVLEEATV